MTWSEKFPKIVISANCNFSCKICIAELKLRSVIFMILTVDFEMLVENNDGIEQKKADSR